MEQRKADMGSTNLETVSSVRASISFSPDTYEMLKRLARKKKVSLAWVVRDAVDRYVAEQVSLAWVVRDAVDRYVAEHDRGLERE